MSAATKLPVAYEEAESNVRAPVVTLIGSDLPSAYLDEAEPSPLMESASRLWKRITNTFKLVIVMLLVGGYPVAMMMSHKVDASPVMLSQVTAWTSPEVGVTLIMAGRELTGPGWASDRPAWHPQARLTALPAWQEGLTSALSDYTLLAASLSLNSEAQADPDLLAAGRLLAPTYESDTIPRLNAAAEALQRYDGRLARGLAAAPSGQDSILAELGLFADWAVTAQERLRTSADDGGAWPASRADIEAIYLARAHAHAAAQLINASLSAEPDLIFNRDLSEARDTALTAWTRAAQFNPVFISSQSGTGRFLSDHPATMAYYMSEAELATKAFQATMIAQTASPVAVASTSNSAP